MTSSIDKLLAEAENHASNGQYNYDGRTWCMECDEVRPCLPHRLAAALREMSADRTKAHAYISKIDAHADELAGDVLRLERELADAHEIMQIRGARIDRLRAAWESHCIGSDRCSFKACRALDREEG